MGESYGGDGPAVMAFAISAGARTVRSRITIRRGEGLGLAARMRIGSYGRLSATKG